MPEPRDDKGEEGKEIIAQGRGIGMTDFFIASFYGDTDQELLELAAKAVGIEIHPSVEGKDCLAIIDHSGYWGNEHIYWNPLTDDGDAFRLAVDMKMIIDPYSGVVGIPPSTVIATVNNGDIYAAIRRAIVQVAAELGKERNDQR